MIKINLLPHELRPIKRTPVPYIASGAVLVMACLLVSFVFLKNVADLASAKSLLREHQKELTALQPVVDEHNALSQKKQMLAKQVQTIDEIASDRIIWSRQLWNLNRLALDNMWYDSIEVATKPFTEMRSVYNPKTKKDELKKVKTDRQVLTLSGYVVPGENGQTSINPFTLATDQDDEFSDLFQLDLTTFRDTFYEEEGVREFDLEYVVDRGVANND